MGNKIFVVYSREDRKGINHLIRSLGFEHTFRNSDEVYKIFSSNIDITEQMEKNITENVEWSDIIVVLVGKETAEVKWIDYCIKKAGMLGRRVVFVYLEEAGPLPDSGRIFGSAAVGMDKVAEAVNGAVPIWEDPMGAPLPNDSIHRSSC